MTAPSATLRPSEKLRTYVLTNPGGWLRLNHVMARAQLDEIAALERDIPAEVAATVHARLHDDAMNEIDQAMVSRWLDAATRARRAEAVVTGWQSLICALAIAIQADAILRYWVALLWRVF